ncbi:histidine phosphatase family protein [Sphingomonas profundi]|uniref:histidine phosphatase family protein n=1 Tax=Alterirhizorhabdus profundi TaxID=2681549 RepID=UPI0012E8C777|nr:histidine phosphatase family protein [Sphingomonas profundi]
MSATIFLARHASHDEVGRVLSGRSEIALSAAGRAEAAALADMLAGVPIAAVHSSPRRRARETAEAVSSARALPVLEADALDEVDFGDWAGRSFDALAGDPDWHRWNAARATAPTPGGETMRAATMRAVAHLGAIVGPGADGAPVLCVSHCDIIRGVVAHYLGLDLDRLLGFDIDPASLTTVELDGDRGRIVALNERPRGQRGVTA